MATNPIISDAPVYQEEYYHTARRPSALRDALPLLGVGVALVFCLVAIGAGMYLSIASNSHAIAVLAALGCAGIIYGLLGKEH
jgi:hypothetical protein